MQSKMGASLPMSCLRLAPKKDRSFYNNPHVVKDHPELTNFVLNITIDNKDHYWQYRNDNIRNFTGVPDALKEVIKNQTRIEGVNRPQGMCSF